MKPLRAIALSAAALVALGGEPPLRAADPRPEIVALEMAGDVSGALNELHAALRADPAQARRLGLLYLRGHLLERLGRLREAADAFAASIAGEPALAPYARLRMARLQDRLGHPEVAAGLAALLLAAAPPPGLVGPATEILAGALERGGDCRVLQAIEPRRLPEGDRRLVQLAAADCHARRGDPGAAAAGWLALLEESVDDSIALAAAENLAAAPAESEGERTESRLGLTFFSHREFDRAMPYLERALQARSGRAESGIDREELELRYALGRSHFWQGRYRAAAGVFADLVPRTRDLDQVQDTLYQQARSEELLGDWRVASHLFRRAAAAQPAGEMAPLAIYSALRLAWRSGDEEQGLALFEQLRRERRYRSTWGRAALFLASSDLVRGRADRALAWLRAARTAGAPAQEIADWLGRRAELLPDPLSAVAAYLDAILPSPSHPLAVEASRRLAGPALAETGRAVGRRLAERPDVPDLYAAWLLLGTSPEGEKARAGLDRVLASDPRSAAFVRSTAAPPRAWPLYAAPAELPEQLILGLGLASDGAPAVLRYFPPDQPPLLLAGARLLLLDGEPRRAIYAAEVLLQRVPDRVPQRALAEDFRRLLFPLPHAAAIAREAARQGVDPHLLAAILREESRFDSGALSGATARGVAQFVRPTARRIAAEIGRPTLQAVDLADPETSIALAARYVANLARDFQGSPPRMVAAYNAGEPQARLWRSYCFSEDPAEYFTKVSFKETRVYVARVLSSREEYAALAAAR
jgi:soluble lytic murein transglycosylase-like protein